MLECRACVQRCIRAIARDELATQSLRRTLILTPQIANRPSRRRIATAAAVRNDEPQDTLSNEAAKSDNKNRSSLNVPVVSRGQDEKALKKELEWLKDPVKLSNHVHYTLRNRQVEKALNLCRLASKSMTCIVAWNHIIDWHIKNGKVNGAIDIYNEMKKRGQFPDSYTYMLLFRATPSRGEKGLDKAQHGQMANKAVAIYNSMNSPTSRVKPSIMHTNAVLRLCSLAQNMDLLWSVASQIPESGPGSADHITYSILLSAIRYGAMGPGTGELVYVEQVAAHRNQAVNEGRRIWQEIIPRWRAGEVIIDAALVTAMAKLLTFSKRMEDWDDVLNLVQQTTNIQRLIPPLGSPERKTEHVPPSKDAQAQAEEEEWHSNSEDSEGWVPTPASNAFKPIQPSTEDQSNHKKRHSLAYVKPENGILNVLLEACTNMRIPKTAYAYWDLFTSKYNINPDLDNYECLFRLLRINRNSRRVAQVMSQMKDHGIKPKNKTFRIAMSACARDIKNTNVVENMTSILDIMIKRMRLPDIVVLDEYIDIAMATNHRPAITKALHKMDYFVERLDEHLHSADTSIPEEYKDRILTFYRHLSGCVDKFSQGEDVPELEAKKWQARRSDYDSLYTNYYKKKRALEKMERRVVEIRDRGQEMKEQDPGWTPVRHLRDAEWEKAKTASRFDGQRVARTAGVRTKANVVDWRAKPRTDGQKREKKMSSGGLMTSVTRTRRMKGREKKEMEETKKMDQIMVRRE